MHGLEPGCQQYQRLSWDSAQLHCQASLLCVSLQQNQDPAPRLQCCFLTASPLSLHPFPLLISNGSNLPFGTLKVKEIVTQLCPTFCDHMDCSLPWFSVHGIFQARINWSRLPFPSLGKSSLPRDWTQVSCLAGRFFTETNQKSPFGTQERSWRLECVLYKVLRSSTGSYCVSRSSVQFSSVAQLCPTLCDPMDCRMPDLPVHHQLPEFTQTHVHWVGDAIQPSHPLSSPPPPLRSWMLLNILQCIGQLTPHNKLLPQMSIASRLRTLLEARSS